MELPISVVMILFVAIAVGVSMVGFSGVTIDRAGQEISDLGVDSRTAQEALVEVSTFTRNQAEALGEQCYRDNRGEMDRILCFIIRADNIRENNIRGLGGVNIADGWEFDTDDLGSDINAVFIYYNPLSGLIEIKS